MGLGNWFNGGDAAAATVKRPDELITVYDERGRELHIRRAAWAESVLLPGLRKAWDDAKQLAGQITQALHDDFAEQVQQAAERLLTLDHESERALILAAIVRMECGALDQAEEALDRSIRRHGPSGSALTNLAKLYEKRGDKASSKTTLRRSLDRDPNQDSLLWWATLAKEERGEAGFIAALEEIASVPGAWRPQLWIAREKLKQGDHAAALALYEQVLSIAADRSDVLMMITGDLGNAGALGDLVRLAAPHFAPEVHGPRPGMNIARAFTQLGRTDEARALVRRLQAMNWPPFAEALAKLEAEIVAASLPQITDAAPPITMHAFERPLWTCGLFEPDWLFRASAANEPTIYLATFANELLEESTPQVRMSEALGRLTRSIPLYLAETFGLGFRLQSRALMLISKAHGPAVVGHMLGRSVLESHLPAGNGRRVVVAGSLVAEGVQLCIWEVGSDPTTETVHVASSLDNVGALVAAIEKALSANLEKRGLLARLRPPAFYQAPSAEMLAGYALALEQLLYQVLAAQDVLPPRSLWNERGLFESYFNLVDRWTNAPESARLLAISGTVAAIQYGSSIVGPYRDLVLHWLDEAAPGSVLYRLAPAVFKRLGETESFERAVARLPKLADAAYMAWLDRVRSAT
jgi:tetratricopeptide (TPR) repeat protein